MLSCGSIIFAGNCMWPAIAGIRIWDSEFVKRKWYFHKEIINVSGSNIFPYENNKYQISPCRIMPINSFETIDLWDQWTYFHRILSSLGEFFFSFHRLLMQLVHKPNILFEIIKDWNPTLPFFPRKYTGISSTAEWKLKGDMTIKVKINKYFPIKEAGREKWFARD